MASKQDNLELLIEISDHITDFEDVLNAFGAVSRSFEREEGFSFEEVGAVFNLTFTSFIRTYRNLDKLVHGKIQEEQEHREKIYKAFFGETPEQQERFKKKREDKQKSLAKLTEKYGSKVAEVIYENVHAQFINQHQKSADTFGQAWDGLDSFILSDITYRAVHGLPCKEKDK